MAIQLRPMTAADVPLGMRLKALAGWNQTEADWRRVLDLDPGGCFVAELDGAAAGVTAVTVFGPVAWVSMVLVDPAARRRGVGTALMRAALAFADGLGVRTLRLQATPMGRPLYERLGFVAEYTLTRYVGTLPAGPPVPEVRPARPDDFDGVLALDREATGTDRTKLLLRLRDEEPGALRVVRRGDVVGYATVRRRTHALQLGPCVATAGAGPLLLEDACALYGREEVFLDVPDDNSAAVVGAERLGLRAERPLLRMSRGVVVADRKDVLWACFGPEKG